MTITKDNLIDAIREGQAVLDATISARISAARKAVGDNGRDQSFIRTVSRRSFQMLAEVTVLASDANAAAVPKPTPRQIIRYATSQDVTSIAWSGAGDGSSVHNAWHHFSHLLRGRTSRLLWPALAPRHCPIRHDIRGCGLLDLMQPAATIDDYVTNIKAVADAAGLTQFPIVATLQAAAVAMRFAALYPDRAA